MQYVMLILVIMIGLGIGLALKNDGPTCEERGGKRVLSHMLPINTGQTIIMMPQYKCEVPNE